MADRKIRVAVIFGGQGSEHAVSCVSAGSVLRNLDRSKFEVIPIGVSRTGAWMIPQEGSLSLEPAEHELPSVSDDGRQVVLSSSGGSHELLPLTSTGSAEALASVDVVFPILHGPYGEDGTMQGLLELAQVPYVGPGVLASALAMDKSFTRKILRAEGLPMGDAVVLRAGESLSEQDKEALGLPVFVKPARAGSSIGVSKVSGWHELEKAVGHARSCDSKVLVERANGGREVECGVLELPSGEIRASLPAELRPRPGSSSHEFYDYEAKYYDDAYDFDIPANLGPDVIQKVQDLAVQAFRALDCRSMVRVDFFVEDDGHMVINEVNTIPGFTHVSMYPKMWEAGGIDYTALLSTLIETAALRGLDYR